jgi:hypothetical protein
MPTPKSNESKDDWMDRCMGDSKMVDEFGNPQQRAAVCNTYFEDRGKEKTASLENEEYEDWGEPFSAAEYQGRKVTLNKPFRTQGGKKKFAVYVQNKAGRVIIVRFGDPNMEIKRDDPKRRKAFRDRHNCSEAKDKTTPKYWSCRQWSTNKVEANNDMTEESVESSMGGCGCGCTGESVEAAEPKPKSDETHDQYMSRCQNMGYSKEECMKAHEGHTFKDQDEAHEDTDHDASYHDDKKKMRAYECPIGEEMVDGKCIRVAVTCEIEIDSIEARIEASTGKSVMRITGVAFTDGVNKNSWGIRPALAQRLTNDMVGADVTLNHPKSEMGRFRRNMDGGVDEATVGVVTEASYHQTSRGYEVRYVAEVHRAELFASLESGLWMRPEYGVSIGGTGIPSEIVEANEEGGRPTMWFADDFEFDHLAIVHRPAYADANIETVEKVIANETFMYQPESSTDYSKVNNMTEEQIESTASEMEALQAELVLREAKIAEYEAADLARAEDARLALVNKASDMGLKGHDDFTTETLNSVIASWESSRPAPAEEPVVDMAPATPAVSEPVEASEESSEPVVANYLNGKIVESSESLYARCYNSWANAYNTVMAGADMQKAKLYEELN